MVTILSQINKNLFKLLKRFRFSTHSIECLYFQIQNLVIRESNPNERL